jgi:hypothetical protein
MAGLSKQMTALLHKAQIVRRNKGPHSPELQEIRKEVIRQAVREGDQALLRDIAKALGL